MKDKSILVLNIEHPSGLTRHIISSIQNKGWKIIILNPDFNCFYKYFALFTSFRFCISEWKKSFDKKMGTYVKSPSTFIRRTAYLKKKLEKINKNYDIVFQFSSMYSHFLKTPKKPYVVFVDWTRSLSHREYPAWSPIVSPKKIKRWLELEGDLYRNACNVFTPSNYTRNSLIADYSVDENKVIVVGYGPTLETIPEENYKNECNNKTILFVGFDFQRKGGLLLLEAFKKVKKVIGGAKLIIVSQYQVNPDIKEDGIVFYDSKTKRDDVLKLFKEASLFVLPSICEPFGLVLLEAMAYKLPCVGTSIDAIPEIIEDEKTGFLVPANDSTTLADKIVFLLKNPELAKKMGEAGFRRMKEKFTWSNVSEKIEIHLLKVLKGN